MTTVRYRPGKSGPLVLSIAGDGGELMDDLPRQIRIETGATCWVKDAEWDDGVWVVDLSELTLPKRLYRASVYYRDGQNWRQAGDFNILFEGGC